MAEFRSVLLSALTLLSVVVNVRGQCAKVTTYNTGLTSYVAKVNTRLPLMQLAIEANDADVVCLQEVWYEKSVESLTESLGSTYPYHYSKLHSAVGKVNSRRFSWWSFFSTDAPCSKSEISYMMSGVVKCAMKNCLGSLGKSVTGCLARKCKQTLDSNRISQSCLSCTLFSLSSMADTMTECASVVGKSSRFNDPGLVLLSKRPIWSVRYRNFHPGNKMWVERGYLEAEIEGVGKVICTHLAAKFDGYMEFDTNFRSYEQQQAAEIRTLGKFRRTDHILMGDLNASPRISFSFNPPRSIQATFPNNYNTLMSYGYTNPYVEKVQLCTFCTENQLTGRDSENHIYDYVLLMGDNYRSIVAQRVLTSYRRQTLSDHYGVEVRFCRFPA